jgi:subtilisin family serine protease
LGAVEISSDVQDRLKSGERARVIITFKDKTNRGKLRKKSSPQEIKRHLRANYKVSSRDVKEIFSRLGKKADSMIVDEFWAANAMFADVSGSVLKELSQRDDVAQITMDRVIPFEEPPANEEVEGGVKDDANYTYGLKILGVDQVRTSYNLSGTGVTVGILDTGIDPSHPDLEGKVVAWKDWSGDEAEKGRDKHGHGTHCAGTIAGGNTSGRQIGVAPNVKLVIGRIFGDKGNASLAGILGAMNWVTDPDGDAETNDAPRVVSNSWGGKQGSMENEQAMWNLVQGWRALNMVPVFAAGNSGPWPKTVGTPGGYPHSFAVGSTTAKDKASSFSSRGPIAWDGVKYNKPDISAPGSGILSAKPGGGYQKMSGTSMACPHMAGLAALVVEANPDYTVEQVEDLLKSTSKDLGKKGADTTYGHGRANIKAAIDQLKGMDNSRLNRFNEMYQE